MQLVKIDPKTPLSSARKSADSQLSKYITVSKAVAVLEKGIRI